MANYSPYTDPVSATTWSAGEAIIRAGNTVAWYDFTDASTLTDDGSGLISSWRDKLGSGHDLIAVTTSRPTLGATGIVFNGTANKMKTGAFTYNQPSHIYLVIKQVTWSASDCFFDGNLNGTGKFMQSTATPGITIDAGLPITVNNEFAVGSFGIIRILFNGANSKLIVNATTATTGNAATGNMGGITVGSRGDTLANFCNMEIKEAVFRNKADSSGDETAIYNYLKAKYSL